MGLLDKFKANREAGVALLRKATEEKTFFNEFYYPERDQQGAASVVLRFLPQKDPNAVPFVSLYRHMFKGDDGKWVVTDLCATTFNEQCEICRCNSELWRTNDPEKQNIARARKRKKEYICNVLVLKDPRNPDNEGKVFPFKFGPSIYEKIKNAITPSYDDEPVINPFDLWEGADFLLRIRKDSQSKQVTYDDSKFANVSALYNGDEDMIVKALEQCVDLSKFIDKSLIVSNEILERKCASAYANTLKGKQAPSFQMNSEPRTESNYVKSETPEIPSEFKSESNASSDDPLAAFKSLVNEVPF